MKILNVTVLLDPVRGGGTAERTWQLSRNLLDCGHQVTLLTTDVGITTERRLSLEGVRVVCLPCVFERFFVVYPHWKLVSAIVRDIDVIHLMGHWNMLNILVYFAARIHAKPYFICPAGELLLFGRSMTLKRLFNVVFGNRLLRNAAGWIAVTPDERSQYSDYGISPQQVRVLPNGVMPEEYARVNDTNPLADMGLQGKDYILFMGRLNPIKGPDLLLEAFCSIAQKFPQVHLVFAGPDGGLRAELEQVIREHALEERTHLVGFISGNAKVSLYRNALFLAIPSRHEAMSIVVLEAGVVGVPVLLTDQCGFDSVGKIGGGLVVRPKADEIAGGMMQMLERRDELPGMGWKLQALVLRDFTWAISVQRHLELFQSAIKAG